MNDVKEEDMKKKYNKSNAEIEDGRSMEKEKRTILILRYHVIPTNDFRLLDWRIVSTS